MEIHKHPHHVTHKKKWGEYLLEFLMLFLAVFLGFIAENIRENVVEQHREKQFMESLVKDLELDCAYADTCNQVIDTRRSSIDSTLNYFIAHPKPSTIPAIVLRRMRRSTWDQIFIDHTGTIDQLKYSGGLRLIRNRQIVDSIESYYQQVSRFGELGHELYRNNQDRIWSLEEKVLDPLGNFTYYQNRENLKDTAITIAIRTDYLDEYLNHLIRLNNSARNDKNNNLTVIRKATDLILLIQKEYHLENE